MSRTRITGLPNLCCCFLFEAAERREAPRVETPSPKAGWVRSTQLRRKGDVCVKGGVKGGLCATLCALAGVVPVPRPASTSQE